jgi:lipoprotein-releasing system ATP-binding protein
MTSPKAPALQAQGLFKAYGTGPARVEVLRGLELTVAAGEFLAILGPSGSGKSTLLNILGLMDRPTEGEVSIAGRPTQGLDEEGRARLRNQTLGFVFQFDSLLPEFTVLENVLFPSRIRAGEPGEAAQKRARELLDSLGIAKLAARFPAQMSGGERQRAAIARALMNRPAIILADEPTGNLDKPNGELVFKDLQALAKQQDVAVAMVTHNETAARFATRVLHMIDGRFEQESVL